MKALVGYTGFVGSNIYAKADFDAVYNSKNIAEAYGTNPDLLVYAGMRAEKYLANNFPEKDMELIYQAEENIEKINPKKLVLISTVDVFKTPKDVDENTKIDTDELEAYGYDRFMLEKWVHEKYPDALIIRLPGLFGKNIKKNFIYDIIKRIPFMLKEDKFNELSVQEPSLKNYYEVQDNGFYKCKDLSKEQTKDLREVILRTGFSAVNFTDSRGSYQFYPLDRLWNDIEIALENNITLFHPATPPIKASDLYEYLTGETFVNECSASPVDYDFKTIHSDLFGGKDGYICDKETVFEQIKQFVESEIAAME